jgi:predicted regulator of Ras-like GTPase activity (Roadblock/LC7/MglB family)
LPSYYERRILQVLDQNKDGLTTVNVAEKAGISKTTALKYLASLRSAGSIDYIEVGPAKLWRHIPPKQTERKRVPTSRTEKIESVLREFKQAVGLEGSAVVDNDGLTISADLPSEIDPEKMGTMVSKLLQIGARSAGMARIDPIKVLIVEGEKGRIVARNEGNVLVIAFSSPETPLGMVKLELEEFAKKVNEIIG